MVSHIGAAHPEDDVFGDVGGVVATRSRLREIIMHSGLRRHRGVFLISVLSA